jgi:hypothetical protein
MNTTGAHFRSWHKTDMSLSRRMSAVSGRPEVNDALSTDAIDPGRTSRSLLLTEAALR